MSSEVFYHPNYDFINEDKICRKKDAPPFSLVENEEIITELARYVESKLINKYNMMPITIPDIDAVSGSNSNSNTNLEVNTTNSSVDENLDPNCFTTILACSNWINAKKLLLIIQNSSGSQMGIFSRSICIDEGISKGSMIPYVERAIANGYSVLILRPNTNSVTIVDPETNKIVKKCPILGSESPEIHVLYVLENIIPQAESVEHIALLAYGNGASLCKDLMLRQMVKSKSDDQNESLNRIKAFFSIEASSIIEEDDAKDIKTSVENMAINMECNAAPTGSVLHHRKKKLGCISLSLGLPEGESEVQNVACSVALALEPAFEYFNLAESFSTADQNISLSEAFTSFLSKKYGVDTTKPEVESNTVEELTPLNDPPSLTPIEPSNPSPPPIISTSPTPDVSKINKRQSSTMAAISGTMRKMSGMFRFTGTKDENGGDVVASDNEETSLTVADFDLLKVVGKGAFGKVMLVRKKYGYCAGEIYAMKVLKKSVIAQLGQIEHTKSEREILFIIRHPFIVRLRFSFQSDEKLFLITDYYNGGSLYSHLRRSKSFDEERARFYAAELLLALDHLHQQNIIYRDLKLENILMDQNGHIALTDFGLSKQNIDKSGGATTFCGTAEYIAPELLNNQKYGKAVDWWSFGILLFEMMNGTTPFYDKNRKLMFYRILNREPAYPPIFSPEACETISGLLRKREYDRLGCGLDGGNEIMRTAFFAVIDFDLLLRKEIRPPFIPDVKSPLDTVYVPESLLKTEAKDSFSDPKKGGNNIKFENFSFQGDSTRLEG